MNTSIEAIVEEVMSLFEEIDWKQQIKKPTNSEVLSKGKSTTDVQKRMVLSKALTNFTEAIQREERSRISTDLRKILMANMKGGINTNHIEAIKYLRSLHPTPLSDNKNEI